MKDTNDSNKKPLTHDRVINVEDNERAKMSDASKETELSDILNKLGDPPYTIERWNEFVDEVAPFVECSDVITFHGVLAFFWLLTRDFRQTAEGRKRMKELCASYWEFGDLGYVLDLPVDSNPALPDTASAS